MKNYEVTKEAVFDNLPLFLGFVDLACQGMGVDNATCSSLKLAVEEACSNIIQYGYAGQHPGNITLSGQREGERLTFVITDSGRSFGPDDAPKPDLQADWQERPIGGLGWHLIRQTVHELSYDPQTNGENRLTLVMKLEPKEAR
jgi:serine/threonine-protein kinase RsbW